MSTWNVFMTLKTLWQSSWESAIQEVEPLQGACPVLLAVANGIANLHSLR